LLQKTKEHVVFSIHFEKEDLNYTPFDAHGGIGKMYELFGDEMEAIIDELNEALAV